jgi:hypothetical protein
MYHVELFNNKKFSLLALLLNQIKQFRYFLYYSIEKFMFFLYSLFIPLLIILIR